MVWPFVAAAATAASAYASYRGVKATNRANSALAQRQMDFQEDMSSTSYQRAMEDMRKAGLNPILAYQQGGASTPSGASAVMQDPMSPAVNSAIAAARAKADIDNLRELNKKIKSDTLLNYALEKAAIADAGLKHNSSKSVIADTILKNAQIPLAKTKSEIDSSKVGKALTMWDRLTQSIGGTVSSFFGKSPYR